MAQNYYFQFGFRKFGVASAPSDIPKIKVVNLADDSVLVNELDTTKSTNLTGLVTYVYNGADNLLLAGRAHSTDTTLDAQDIFYFVPDGQTP